MPTKVLQESAAKHMSGPGDADPFEAAAENKHKNVPISQVRHWNDLSMQELHGKLVDEFQETMQPPAGLAKVSADAVSDFRKFRA